MGTSPPPPAGWAPWRRARPRAVALVLVVTVAACGAPAAQSPTTTGPRTRLALAVAGNRLVNGQGRTVVLRGADTSGTEFACVQRGTVFPDAEEAAPATIAAMQAWGIDAVRVQLNESCWLGIQGVAADAAGPAYRRAVERYVAALRAAGMYVIVNLQWASSGGSAPATRQLAMPDERYAPAFWQSVAAAFAPDPGVVFDLFSEPFPDGDTDTPAAWDCLLHGSAGGACTGFGFAAAGTQQLVDAIRGTGADNVIMVAGPGYATDLDQWRAYEPVDPRHQLAASVHIYWGTPSAPDDSTCAPASCWSGTLAPLAAQVPVVVGEFGEYDCGSELYRPFLRFADRHGISYLIWAWYVGSCTGFPSVISSYGGTPTAFGAGYRRHLAALHGG